MINANEVNSIFYALRLLSHGVDISQIEVTGGEEYPASEFTREEQVHALNILHSIEESKSAPYDPLSQEKIHFYLTALSDRIEDLVNTDLLNAGYIMETPLPDALGRDIEGPMPGRLGGSNTEGEEGVQMAEVVERQGWGLNLITTSMEEIEHDEEDESLRMTPDRRSKRDS